MGKRAKEFNVKPDPVLCVLSKVLDATRNKSKLSDREQYKDVLPPGEHHYQGVLSYDIRFTVGEESESDRYYGTPIDSILSLAFYYSGALREHFVRAAMIIREIRLAELEDNRPYHDVTYSFKRKADNEQGYQEVEITIPAEVIESEATRISNKMFGENDKEITIVQEQVADCTSKLKVTRKYDGPINLEDVSIDINQEYLALEEVA